MPEPQSYNAQAEAAKMPPPKEPLAIEQVDEDRLLMRPEDKGQLFTDLRQWLTFSLADRTKKSQVLAEMKLEQYDPDRKVARDRKKRVLLRIIFREVFHPQGRREPALEAFRGLFPEKKA